MRSACPYPICILWGWCSMHVPSRYFVSATLVAEWGLRARRATVCVRRQTWKLARASEAEGGCRCRWHRTISACPTLVLLALPTIESCRPPSTADGQRGPFLPTRSLIVPGETCDRIKIITATSHGCLIARPSRNMGEIRGSRVSLLFCPFSRSPPASCDLLTREARACPQSTTLVGCLVRSLDPIFVLTCGG